MKALFLQQTKSEINVDAEEWHRDFEKAAKSHKSLSASPNGEMTARESMHPRLRITRAIADIHNLDQRNIDPHF